MRGKRFNIIVMLAFFLILFFGVTICGQIGIPKENPRYSKVVAPYDTGTLPTDFVGEAYAMGANSRHKPVFKDRDAAFQKALVDFKDGFRALQQQYWLLPPGKLTWRRYKIYGWQLVTKDRSLQKQGADISCFFDIYENSFGE